MKAQIVELVKLNLGIKGSARDDFLIPSVESAVSELAHKGVELTHSTDDLMLAADYAAWLYRTRESGDPLPKNIELRIHNRVTKRRMSDV